MFLFNFFLFNFGILIAYNKTPLQQTYLRSAGFVILFLFLRTASVIIFVPPCKVREYDSAYTLNLD